MTKKKVKPYRDFVHNNPRADGQEPMDADLDNAKKNVQNKMLYDAKDTMAKIKEILRKKKIAKISGYFQMLLAFLGLVEVIRRFIGMKEIPVFQNMIVISINGLML